MLIYKRILVPLDGSKLAEQVLPYACKVGKGLNSRLELVRVVEPLPPIGLTDPAHEARRHQALITITGIAEDYLNELATALKRDELAVDYSVSQGDPALDIVERAEVQPATLIAMSSHGRSGIARWMMGSVADKVLCATTRPLLLIRAEEDNPPVAEVRLDTIIVPLDESSQAEKVLPHVTALSTELEVKVILLRVTPYPEEYYRYMEYPPAHFNDFATDVDYGAVQYLEKMTRSLLSRGVSEIEHRLSHGSPAAAITDLAQETPNSLIAMTTHGRSGVGRWILGSVADRVVRHSGDPVLLVRPKI